MTRARTAWALGLVLAGGISRPALAADGGTSLSGLDVGVEQRTSRAPSGAWDFAVDGSAVLPVVDVSSQFRLGLRLTNAGSLEHVAAHWSLTPDDLTQAQALFWNGHVDRGPNSQVAISFTGGIRLDALADRLGLPRTAWVELGLQSRAMGVDTSGQTRMSSTLVLALDFDAFGASVEGRATRTSSGLRIRASAALGNDPGCNFGTPSLLFSGRCLTLALAVEF